MTTQRVHVSDDYDVYGGRPKDSDMNLAKAQEPQNAGKLGWLGNPYPVDGYGREGAIRLYERDLTWLIEEKVWFREAIKNLYGKRIACFCADHQDCHVDVLVQKINKLYVEDLDSS